MVQWLKIETHDRGIQDWYPAMAVKNTKDPQYVCTPHMQYKDRQAPLPHGSSTMAYAVL